RLAENSAAAGELGPFLAEDFECGARGERLGNDDQPEALAQSGAGVAHNLAEAAPDPAADDRSAETPGSDDAGARGAFPGLEHAEEHGASVDRAALFPHAGKF